jgi:endonuclease/exonuclease/phosphatase family metal-dependent hydrolase
VGILALAWLTAGCAAGRPVMISTPAASAAATCRLPVAGDGSPSPHLIRWAAPVSPGDRGRLDAWCATTGPPVVLPRPARVRSDGTADLVVISWNVHGGLADVTALIRRVESGEFTDGVPASHFVLLLQEAHRRGPLVPWALPPGAPVPRAIRPGPAAARRADLLDLARGRGLAAYYVPSMRNGGPDDTDEDRGNAILSTEPLSDFEAIELPFVRQRRVAIAATLSGRTARGVSWSMRVASVHLDNLASPRRLWIAATGTRVRQARGLLSAVGRHGALVIGGDFNTWFGFADPAYRTISGVVPDAAVGDTRPTFGSFLRLDHLFARLPGTWTIRARRVNERYGSDHHALVARVRVPDAAALAAR